MAQGTHSRGTQNGDTPHWSKALRALREARGITQEGWATQIGYSRATVRRWESGSSVPSADAELQIIALCREKRLFQRFHEGPLRGVHVGADWISDLLATARLQPDTATETLGDGTDTFTVPSIKYAANEDVSLAYQAFGEGPFTYLITPGTISHRELDWENTGMREFLLHLAQTGRVVIYDKRSTGLSDRVTHGSIQDRITDLRAVMDAEAIERAVVVGFTEGGSISIKFAATWPERVKALVLYGTSARVSDISPETNARKTSRLQRVWGTPDSGFLKKFAPSATFTAQEREWWARYQRMGASPGAIRDLNLMNKALDVHAILPTLRVPTLLVHRKGDLVTPFEEAVQMAQEVPRAKLVALEGEDHLAWAGNVKEISGAIIEFVSGLGSQPQSRRVLTTLVSFSVAPEYRPFALDLMRNQPLYQIHKELNSGLGDPVLSFDSPSKAVSFAQELVRSAANQHIHPGVGVHTGEVSLEQRVVYGDTVDTCTGLAGLAEPGTVLVSDTVARLVSQPNFSFRVHRPEKRGCQLNGTEIFQMRTIRG